MTTLTRSLLSLLQRLRRQRPVDVEAADMGTCFGLEMSLDEPGMPETPPELPTFSRAWWAVWSGRKAASA
jgi:hypothetical protein